MRISSEVRTALESGQRKRVAFSQKGQGLYYKSAPLLVLFFFSEKDKKSD
jgi:hypothetical protein